MATYAIGDLQGCLASFDALRAQLPIPDRFIFVGDLVDRGPKIPEVLRLVMNAVATGAALCVPGNHDVKLMRKLRHASALNK